METEDIQRYNEYSNNNKTSVSNHSPIKSSFNSRRKSKLIECHREIISRHFISPSKEHKTKYVHKAGACSKAYSLFNDAEKRNFL